MGSKLAEIAEELRTVVVGRSGWVDMALPLVLFALLDAMLAPQWAGLLALLLAAMLALWRWKRGQRVRSALGGLAGVVLAIGFVLLTGQAQALLYPGILTGALSVFLAVASVVFRRPFVAWTSHLARRWPLAWYWHPRVRPAYGEVTLFWAMFFALRVGLQVTTARDAMMADVAIIGVLLGWPSTLVLLITSYLYGSWRLKTLRGPSVQEFREGSPPPWTGQLRGF